MAAFCAFTQGNVSMPGVPGRMAKSRIVQLMEHGCFACGSVPFGEGKGEDRGILTVDSVSRAVRNGRPGQVVCDPTIPPPPSSTGSAVRVPIAGPSGVDGAVRGDIARKGSEVGLVDISVPPVETQ